MSPTLQSIKISDIVIREGDTRNVRDEANGDDLVASIKSFGILQPLVVTKNGHGYELDAGHRRLDGAKKAGLTVVDCMVHDVGDEPVPESDVVLTMLIENMARLDLNPVEQAKGFARLIALGLKQKAIADHTGISPSLVSKRMALLKLPTDALVLLADGSMSIDYAEALLQLKDEPLVIAQAIEQGWNGYQINSAGSKIVKEKARAKAEKLVTEAGLELVTHMDLGTIVPDSKPPKIRDVIELEPDDDHPYDEWETVELTPVELANFAGRKDAYGICINEHYNHSEGGTTTFDGTLVILRKPDIEELADLTAEELENRGDDGDAVTAEALREQAEAKRVAKEKRERKLALATGKYVLEFFQGVVADKHTAAEIREILVETVIDGLSHDSLTTAAKLLQLDPVEVDGKNSMADAFKLGWAAAKGAERDRYLLAGCIADNYTFDQLAHDGNPAPKKGDYEYPRKTTARKWLTNWGFKKFSPSKAEA